MIWLSLKLHFQNCSLVRLLSLAGRLHLPVLCGALCTHALAADGLDSLDIAFSDPTKSIISKYNLKTASWKVKDTCIEKTGSKIWGWKVEGCRRDVGGVRLDVAGCLSVPWAAGT